MTVNNKERSVGNHKICLLLNLQGDVSLQKFTIHSDMAQLIELTGSNQNHTHIGLPRHHKLTFMKFICFCTKTWAAGIAYRMNSMRVSILFSLIFYLNVCKSQQ